MEKFFRVENIIIDKTGIFDSASEQHLYIVLCRYCNYTKTAFPSIDKLSKITMRSKKTVVTALNSLEKKGLILRKKFRGRNSLYMVIPLQKENFPEHLESLGEIGEKVLKNIPLGDPSDAYLEGERLYLPEEYDDAQKKRNLNDPVVILVQNLISNYANAELSLVKKLFPPIGFSLDDVKKMRDEIAASSFLSGNQTRRPEFQLFITPKYYKAILAGEFRDNYRT